MITIIALIVASIAAAAAVSDFYLQKRSERVTYDLIASNENLSRGANRQATALTIFTAGIFLATMAQVPMACLRRKARPEKRIWEAVGLAE